MSTAKRKRFTFRPTVTESRLEERVVLSTATAASKVYVIAPPTQVATSGATPAPAPAPISAQAAAMEMRPLTLARLRKDYRKQVRIAARDLRNAIQTQVGQLYANGATPTAQQLSNFNAGIAGALDATALRLSVQAALLPNSGAKLVPALQNAILGSGPRSLASRLTSLAQSGQLSGASGASTRALNRAINTASLQTNTQLNNFFNTTPVTRLSVNSSGQRVPLQQFIGGQLVNEVGNSLGSLAQSFPSVANAMLFPNGTTGTPDQSALNAFNSQVNSALGTAAFILGSGLSLFPNASNVVSQLQSPLFGGPTTSNTPGLRQLFSSLASLGSTGMTGATGTTGALGLLDTTGATGTAGSVNNLVSALQNLQFGSPNFNTGVSNAFSGAFQNLATPIARFFGMTGQTNAILPTSGFTSLFGTPFTGSSFFNGFNNGFVTGTTPGFIGFGMAPTTFNSAFGTGFNNFVTNFNTGLGFNNAVGLGSGVNGIGSGNVNGGIGSGNVNGGIGTGVGTGVNGGVGSGNLTGTGGGII